MTHSCPTRRASDLTGTFDLPTSFPGREIGSELQPTTTTTEPSTTTTSVDDTTTTTSDATTTTTVASPSTTEAPPETTTTAAPPTTLVPAPPRSAEHTSDLQSTMTNSYAVFC